MRAPLRLNEKGRWRVELRGPHQLLKRTLTVGGSAPGPRRKRPVVLAVGDSMMSPLDVLLTDRLPRRARVHTRVRVSSGLSTPRSGWIRHARWQARRFRPYATVVFLGTNDAFDMRTPEGLRVTCCRADWVGEYARRAGRLMRAYSRRGRSRVLWLTLPAPRSVLRWPVARAINYAARFAAARTPGATIVSVDEVFTPGFRYRATMRYHGRRVRVRHSDGIHLSLEGSAILERIVERKLKLPRR